MKFCKNCKNYMKISEIDIKNTRNIYYVCNQCDYIEDTNNFLIFQKKYKQIKKNIIKNPEYFITDRTLPKKKTKCPKCKHKNHNVYYQNNDLTITLICKECKHIWIYS